MTLTAPAVSMGGEMKSDNERRFDNVLRIESNIAIALGKGVCKRDEESEPTGQEIVIRSRNIMTEAYSTGHNGSSSFR